MFHAPAHKSSSAGQVNPGLAALHALCDAQAVPQDFRVSHHGSVVLLTPLTDDARSWCRHHLPHDAQSWGGSIAVEPRYISPIIDGITEDGLSIRKAA